MEEAVPPALVLGCNTPHGIGVLSDWIEERTGHAPDFHERLTGGASDGAALVYQRRVSAGVRAGDSLRSAHDASRDAGAADKTRGGCAETNRKECCEVIDSSCQLIRERLQADDSDGAIELIMAMRLKDARQVGEQLNFPGAWRAKTRAELRKICERYAPLSTKTARENYERDMRLDSICLDVRHVIEACADGRTLIDVCVELCNRHKLTPSDLSAKMHDDGDLEILRDKYDLTQAELRRSVGRLQPGRTWDETLIARGEKLLAESYSDWLLRLWPDHSMHAEKLRRLQEAGL